MANEMVQQISTIVQDALEDAIGKTASTSAIETTDFVSMGNALGDGTTTASLSLYERWFGSLVNRITKTIYAVRVYNPKSRGILRDETEWGAYVQKVHYHLHEAVDNPAFSIPTISDSTRTYTQSSPYDVETSPEVSVLVFGGQGTWSIEFVRPIAQIMTAFTGESEMLAFIDGLYVYAENSMKLEIEAVERAAANTAIAMLVNGEKAINVLSAFNDATGSALTVDTFKTSPEFWRFFTQYLVNTVKYMEDMSVKYNIGGYEKFTPRERNIVEVLTLASSCCEMYLQSDTYHKELVSLPRYSEVNFWQTQGTSIEPDFDEISKINIQHEEFITDDNTTGTITQTGILAYLHDIDEVGAYFGEVYNWEEVNPRSRVVISGKQARKGYGVDPNENGIVFYVA